MKLGRTPRRGGLLVLACLAACGGGGGRGDDSGLPDGGPSAGGSVAGTITLPANVTEVCALVGLDTDATGGNGAALREDGSEIGVVTLVSGDALEFVLEDVPSGSYFLWAFVDADASASNPPESCEVTGGPASGDFLGWYDAGLAEPQAPNVPVPHPATAVFDFPLGVVP